MKSDIEALRQALAAGPTPGKRTIHKNSSTTVCIESGRVVASCGGASSNLPGDEELPERQAADALLIAAASPDRIARLLDALELAQRDADRYRFLNHDFSVMGANIDGDHSWAYRRNFSLRGPTLDAAIDEAMKDAP